MSGGPVQTSNILPTLSGDIGPLQQRVSQMIRYFIYVFLYIYSLYAWNSYLYISLCFFISFFIYNINHSFRGYVTTHKHLLYTYIIDFLRLQQSERVREWNTINTIIGRRRRRNNMHIEILFFLLNIFLLLK